VPVPRWAWGRGDRPSPNRGYPHPPNLAVLLTHCGQLILRRISKLDATTRCQILRLKCTKFDFHWSSVPVPAGGAVFKTAYFKGEGVEKGEAKRGGEKGRRKGRREGEGKEREEGRGKGRGQTPKYFGPEPCLSRTL